VDSLEPVLSGEATSPRCGAWSAQAISGRLSIRADQRIVYRRGIRLRSFAQRWMWSNFILTIAEDLHSSPLALPIMRICTCDSISSEMLTEFRKYRQFDLTTFLMHATSTPHPLRTRGKGLVAFDSRSGRIMEGCQYSVEARSGRDDGHSESSLGRGTMLALSIPSKVDAYFPCKRKFARAARVPR
jgi:hypothetical protein